MARFKTKYSGISISELESLASRAAGGDTSALAELGRKNAMYGRAANQRARELEKRGLETGAYIRARESTGKEKPRFSQAKTGSAESLLRSIEETAKFLNYQTSAISGEMLRRENIMKGMERAGYNVGNNREAFLRFLDSNAWTEIRGMFGSKDAMQRVSDALESGADIEDLILAYQEFEQGESEAEDILQVWDGWANEDNYS